MYQKEPLPPFIKAAARLFIGIVLLVIFAPLIVIGFSTIFTALVNYIAHFNRFLLFIGLVIALGMFGYIIRWPYRKTDLP